MTSRREKYKKKNLAKQGKLLIGALLLFLGIGSSINIAFADQDIESMLTNWVDNQKTKSIKLIETAVLTEKEVQLKRLKEELQLQKRNVERQLENFTEIEKDKRIQAIEEYADQLIESIKIDNTGEQTKIKNEFDMIIAEAKSKMDIVSKDESTKKSVEEPSTTIAEPTKDLSHSTTELIEEQEPTSIPEEPVEVEVTKNR